MLFGESPFAHVSYAPNPFLGNVYVGEPVVEIGISVPIDAHTIFMVNDPLPIMCVNDPLPIFEVK